MNITLKNGQRCGMTSAPSSKSHAQRLLICAGLGASGVTLDCGDISKDIAAAASCVQTLCADVTELHEGVLRVEPCAKPSKGVKVLHCGESGSTLRFLIPVCGALGESVVFKMEGRLSERPLSPLDEVLTEHGMTLERIGTELHCSGKLTGGEFEIAGNVSSQFISGLLFALPLLDTDSTLTVTGKLESSAYIAMTENALRQSGIEFAKNDNVYAIPGNQRYRLNEACTVEGDLSNAAFFLCMGALSDKGVTVKNIPEHTSQGDKKIIDILRSFGADVAVNGDSVAVKKGRLTACTVDAS
ncbi:3-phosphoshikimate 1-carboxyvinyltransferase [Firmicutes bacterium CAG:555]|nr:3-phosphoshikimate 1-carboxyvinyltransferase [Firmicutes bacterium CAG:555]